MSNRTCKACGWVHFGVTREHAEQEVAKFNAYYATLPLRQQRDYYGGKASSIRDYERCFRCGGPYTNFRPSEPDDCPDGCTIGPIIDEPQDNITKKGVEK